MRLAGICGLQTGLVACSQLLGGGLNVHRPVHGEHPGDGARASGRGAQRELEQRRWFHLAPPRRRIRVPMLSIPVGPTRTRGRRWWRGNMGDDAGRSRLREVAGATAAPELRAALEAAAGEEEAALAEALAT